MLRWLGFAIPRRRGHDQDRLALDNGRVRVEVHPQTGGVLAIRRDRDAANRLTQQLAVRSSLSQATAGPPRDSAADASATTRMIADSLERVPGPNGCDVVVSTGRLVAAAGGTAARFRQQIRLSASLPLALIDIEVRLERPLAGPLLENHVAARFAWHENEHVEIRRSLLTQSVATERTRFTAPHFIEIAPEGAASIQSATGSRSSPVACPGTCSRRLTSSIPCSPAERPRRSHAGSASDSGCGVRGMRRSP